MMKRTESEADDTRRGPRMHDAECARDPPAVVGDDDVTPRP
ncbi:unnamed protein product, partial [Nippostrongylus brasiliensis]|uniref:Transcriptional regulator n=1 Tax=Nippostrongylus brasiliensis TaxID=27835 RepID=A0A0N4XS63_NIPBR